MQAETSLLQGLLSSSSFLMSGGPGGLSRHPDAEGVSHVVRHPMMSSFLSVLSDGKEKAQGAVECRLPQCREERFVHSSHPQCWAFGCYLIKASLQEGPLSEQ